MGAMKTKQGVSCAKKRLANWHPYIIPSLGRGAAGCVMAGRGLYAWLNPSLRPPKGGNRSVQRSFLSQNSPIRRKILRLYIITMILRSYE
jgi:hypothetical protein